jgi:transposase
LKGTPVQLAKVTPDLLTGAWELASPLIPPAKPTAKGGRPRAGDRACFDGIVSKYWNRRRWRDLPPGCPSGPTCWRRLQEWQRAGVWDPVWRVVVEFLDESLGSNRARYEFVHDDRPVNLHDIEASLVALDPNSSNRQLTGVADEGDTVD